MNEPTVFRVEHPQPDRLRLVGELDVQSAPQLDAALEPLDGAAIDVDLSGVTFADSSGLRALVRAKRNHHGVRLVRPTPALARLVEITGLTDALSMADGTD